LGNDVDQIDFGDLSDRGPNVVGLNVTFFNPSTGAISECDMRFDDSRDWNTGPGLPGPTEVDWQSIAAHEMGHCLGLGHEETEKAVMNPVLVNGEVSRELTQDDEDGRNFIYGSPQPMVVRAIKSPKVSEPRGFK